jgi:SAM-dependent methyltransferase
MAKINARVIKSKSALSNDEYLKKWGVGGRNYDIGCGPGKVPGVDIIHDLNISPWPIEKESSNLVIASHVIEHVDNVIAFMSEVHRVLKKGGKAVIRYPHFSQRHTFRDPTHKRFMTLESLDFFIVGSELFGEYSDFRFQIMSKILHIDNDIGFLIGKISFEAYEKYWCHIFPAWQVIVELEKE